MKRIRAQLLILLTYPFVAIAQHPEAIRCTYLLHRAEQEAADSNYTQAYADWDSAFAHVSWGAWDRLQAAETAIAHGDTAHALHYLESIYRSGAESLIPYGEHLKGFVAQGFEAPELGRLLTAQWEWHQRADSAWIDAITAMNTYFETKGWDGKFVVDGKDSALARMDDLITVHGFPDPARTGTHFGKFAWLLDQLVYARSDDPHVRSIIAAAEAAIASGVAPPDLLCELKDQEAIYRGRPMLYGVLLMYYSDSARSLCAPDWAALDDNRARAGLLPIKEAMRRFGVDPGSIVFSEP